MIVALDLFTESVMKPDHDLRGCAHNQGCYEFSTYGYKRTRLRVSKNIKETNLY